MKKTIIVLSVFVLFFFALFGVLEIPKYHQGSRGLQAASPKGIPAAW
jgi:hypothetical protein